MNNILDRYAPKKQFYGFYISVVLLYKQNDFESLDKPKTYNNFEIYDYLYAIVSGHWQDNYLTVNNILMNLFISSDNTYIAIHPRHGHIRIKLSLFTAVHSKVPKTFKELESFSNILAQIGEEMSYRPGAYKQGGKISTLGEI